jgi:dolichol-phosphate mannosyltransferase
MSPIIVVQFLGLVLSKFLGGVLPASFLLFGVVGASGVLVHMGVLWLTHERLSFSFAIAQLTATLVAMTTNFILNNELTYADKKLRGVRFWIGLVTFYVVCSIGTLANVSVASWIYVADPNLYVAGFLGALMSVVFNYSVTRVFTWR